jgi:hypothetical protein
VIIPDGAIDRPAGSAAIVQVFGSCPPRAFIWYETVSPTYQVWVLSMTCGAGRLKSKVGSAARDTSVVATYVQVPPAARQALLSVQVSSTTTRKNCRIWVVSDGAAAPFG